MLKIISAFYDSLDVTNIVRNKVIDDKELDIIASNVIFGDPNFGKVKNLIIKYEINNKEYDVTINENQSYKIVAPDTKLNDNQVISTFLDFNYFPLFASLYNSLRYYNNNGKIKVYDWNNLNNFQIEYLSKFADVVTVKNPSVNYPNNFGFISHNMVDYLDDYELKMDCDMIALSNFDHIFDYLKDGYLVGCEELKIKPLYYCPNHVDNIEREKFLNLFNNYTNLDLSKYNPNEDIPIYNGGFMGYSKTNHLDLLKNCKNIIYSDFAYKYFMIDSDQNLLSFLLNSTKKYKIHNLPNYEWMNTWNLHLSPSKYIIVDNNGKYKLYDTEGRLIKLYHFTGLVGYNILSEQDTAVRGFQITGDYLSMQSSFNEDEITRRGQEMWRERNKTPINFLFEYFHNNGDFKTPKFYNVKFRKIVTEFCKEYFKDDQIINTSKEVMAVCIAFDYITLLDYTIDNLGWIEIILLKLFTIYNSNYTKHDYTKKTIGLDNDNCNVSLSFNYKPNFKPWIGTFTDNKELNVEEYLGLYITTKK